MSRIINTNGTPASHRNRQRRTIVEALHSLMRKPAFDDQSRDLTAAIVFNLREIDGSIEHSAMVWEDKGYYMKAETFRREWAWVAPLQRLITSALLEGHYDTLPTLFAQLLGQMSDVNIPRQGRPDSEWEGNYERLREEMGR